MTNTANSSKEIEQERQLRVETEEILMAMKGFLFEYFHGLGPDPQANMDIIVKTACNVLKSTAALYNRLDGNMLKTWSIHNEPPGFQREDTPHGHICYDMTIKEKSPEDLSPVILENLAGSKWETLDSNVQKYKLKSYLAYPVLLENQVVGSLCVVDAEQRSYSAIEQEILEAFAKAITLEEERKLSNERLKLRNRELREKNIELEAALQEVKTLSGLLPICSSCKKIRDDSGYWNRIETYIKKHSEAEFSHSICEDCAQKLRQEWEQGKNDS